MNHTSKIYKKAEVEEQEIDLKQIVEQYAYYWKWFVISLIAAICLAAFYLWYITPQYKVDAKILLENEDKASGELAGLAELSNLTGGGGRPLLWWIRLIS